MTAIVWTTLITAVATVTASLGAVWIKSSYDDRAQARQARPADRGRLTPDWSRQPVSCMALAYGSVRSSRVFQRMT
jgi:hypothetical protein